MIEVLVVDDSRFMAKALCTILEELEFKVVAMAHDGYEGIEQFVNHRPDVVLLDVTMPNMDGMDCLSKIREIDGEAKVVMLSAIQDPATIERCLSLGASSFLQKPIRKNSPTDLCRLCETLEEAVAKAV